MKEIAQAFATGLRFMWLRVVHGLVVLASLWGVVTTHADVLVLKDGTLISGTVERNDQDGILFRRSSGTYTYPSGSYRDFHTRSTETGQTEKGIPRLSDILLKCVEHEWFVPAKQIPATVISTGILRQVPYVSFRGNYDYEVNVYGDEAQPAGFEMGIHRSLLKQDTAKSNCLSFILGLLAGEEQRDALLRLGLKEGTVAVGSVTIEITPPTASDAYGGWWISVYDKDRIERSRASEKEMQSISVPVASAASSGAWSAEELKLARPSSPQPITSAPSYTYRRTSSPSRSSGGSVYVKSYTRKDGTYVSGHTRSRPRR